jgi:predicted nucleic acid-binding protein
LQRSPDLWVIDVSVINKWYLRDEDDLEKADYFEGLSRHPIGAVRAPHLSRHEVANALATACRSGRITRDMADRDLAAYVRTDVSLDNDPYWLLRDAVAFAIHFKIAIHDAVYLALAGAISARFITADEKLWRLVAPELEFVEFIRDFNIP